MKKTRILAITPYEGMGDQMAGVAASLPDVEVEIHTGDLEEGVQIFRRVWDGSFDAVISRGRTAMLIEQVAEVPVVEVRISGYDLLRAMRMVENYSGKYAIVGFPNIMREVNVLCDLLQYQADIFTTQSTRDIVPVIKSLREKGYTLVVGDVAAVREAKRSGLNGILISSGPESIEEAIRQAVKFTSFRKRENEEYELLQKVLAGCGSPMMAATPEGKLRYANFDVERLAPLVEQVLSRGADAVGGRVHRIEEADGVLWSVTVTPLETAAPCLLFRLDRIGSGGTPAGIRVYNYSDVDDQVIFQTGPGMSELVAQAVKMGETPAPMLIVGEYGVGKEPLARAVHGGSPFRKSCMIIVDCALISPRDFKSLLEGSDSLLRAKGVTVYFHSISPMEPEMRRRLLAYLEQNLPLQENKYILSGILDNREDPALAFLEGIRDRHGLLTLYIPPLRERSGDIPSLVSLYLNDLDLQLGRQVIGLEPEAMALLQQYRWEGNIFQLRRVLRELVITTEGSFIAAASVAQILKKEAAQNSPTLTPLIDSSKSLEDIERDIIMLVLREENMNQSKAAQRLGISRSTLWRKLKE